MGGGVQIEKKDIVCNLIGKVEVRVVQLIFGGGGRGVKLTNIITPLKL